MVEEKREEGKQRFKVKDLYVRSLVHSIFLKIYMELEGLKDQKLAESSFSEKLCF